MSDAVQTYDPYRWTFDMQVEALNYVWHVVKGCYQGVSPGQGKKWMNRAYCLGGDVIGLPFPIAKQAFEDCAHINVRAVASGLTDLIRKSVEPGDLYIARDDLSGHYKVGYSLNPKIRVASLAFETRRPLKIIYTECGYMLNEHYLHSIFMVDRIGNEWFSKHSRAIPGYIEYKLARERGEVAA